jgi:hypothetical protein
MLESPTGGIRMRGHGYSGSNALSGAQPRVRYVLVFPLLLAATAVLLWSIPTDFMTMAGSLIGTIVAAYLFFDWVFTEQPVRFSTICALGLLSGYATGTLNSWLTYPRAGYPLATVTYVPVTVLAGGLAGALLACACLLAIGELVESPPVPARSRIVFNAGLKNIIAVATLILMVAAAAGMFQQGGIVAQSTGAEGHAGVVALFLYFLIGPTLVLATSAFLVERSRRDRLWLGIAMTALWLLDFTQGRRDIIYPAIVTMAVARMAGYEWRKVNLARALLLAGGGVLLVAGIFVYTLLRIAGSSNPNAKLPERISMVAEWAVQGRALEMAADSNRTNLQGRTLVLGFLADLIDRSSEYRPGYGQDLAYQLEIVIPSALGKADYIPAEEDLASKLFSRNYPDQPNSVLTAGAVDFGLLGALTYPLLAVLSLALFLRLAKVFFSTEMYVYALVSAYLLTIAAEEGMAAYFLYMRNVVLLGIVIQGIAKLPRLQLAAADPHLGAGK